jgi:hypothetical protein
MVALQHVYLTAHGSFNTGPYLGEAAQFGLRLSFAPKASEPSLGETFAMQSNGDVSPLFGTQSGTHGALAKTWEARVGAVGSPFTWGPTEQIAAGEAVWTFLNAMKAYNHGNYSWKTVKQAAIDATGHTQGTQSIYTFTSPLVGSGSNALPAQVAMAITMRANIMGRTGRGRIYYPALSTALTSDGSTGTTFATACRTNLKTLIDSLQAIDSGNIVYMPIVSITSAGKSTAVRPVEVRTGQLLDTVKSRRAQVDEVYTTLAL